MKIRSTLMLSLLALPLCATAANPPNQAGYGRLSYTLGEVRVVAVDPDGPSNSADGVSLDGTALVMPDLLVTGSLTSTGSNAANGVDEDTFEGGVGLRHALTSDIDILGVAGVAYQERHFTNRDDNDIGPMLMGGVRSMVAPKIEVGGYLKYVDLFGDSTLGVRGEGLYHFTPNFSTLVAVGLSDNDRTAELGARWYFKPGH